MTTSRLLDAATLAALRALDIDVKPIKPDSEIPADVRDQGYGWTYGRDESGRYIGCFWADPVAVADPGRKPSAADIMDSGVLQIVRQRVMERAAETGWRILDAAHTLEGFAVPLAPAAPTPEEMAAAKAEEERKYAEFVQAHRAWTKRAEAHTLENAVRRMQGLKLLPAFDEPEPVDPRARPEREEPDQGEESWKGRVRWGIERGLPPGVEFRRAVQAIAEATNNGASTLAALHLAKAGLGSAQRILAGLPDSPFGDRPSAGDGWLAIDAAIDSDDQRAAEWLQSCGAAPERPVYGRPPNTFTSEHMMSAFLAAGDPEVTAAVPHLTTVAARAVDLGAGEQRLRDGAAAWQARALEIAARHGAALLDYAHNTPDGDDDFATQARRLRKMEERIWKAADSPEDRARVLGEHLSTRWSGIGKAAAHANLRLDELGVRPIERDGERASRARPNEWTVACVTLALDYMAGNEPLPLVVETVAEEYARHRFRRYADMADSLRSMRDKEEYNPVMDALAEEANALALSGTRSWRGNTAPALIMAERDILEKAVNHLSYERDLAKVRERFQAAEEKPDARMGYARG